MSVENRIFVGGLSPNVGQDAVNEYFQQFGQTTDVYLPLFYGTDRHKGIAYVTFSLPEAAMEALNYPSHNINGEQITVQECQPKGHGKGNQSHNSHQHQHQQQQQHHGNTNHASLPAAGDTVQNRVFIQGIGANVTQQEVEAYFMKYGEWTDFYMPRGHFAAGHKGIAFVTFSSDSAVRAILNMGQHVLNGHTMNVDRAVSRDAAKGSGKGALGKFGKAFESLGLGRPNNAFEAMQGLCTMMINSGMMDQMQMNRLGGGGPNRYDSGRGNIRSGGQAVWSSSAHQNNGGHAKPFTQTGGVSQSGRIFVTKISPTVTKDDLEQYFSQYGALNDVYVPGGGKNIAFVGFEDPAVAQQVMAIDYHEVKPNCPVCVDAAVERNSSGGKSFGKGGGMRAIPY